MSKHRNHSQNVTRAMTPSAPDTPISDALKETAPPPANEPAVTPPSTEGVLQCTAAGTAHDCCASWDGYCHRVPGPHACCAPRGTMADRRNDDHAVPHADADAPFFNIPTMGRIVWVRGANVRAPDPDAWVPAIVVASDEKAGMIEVVAFGPSPCDVFARVMLDAIAGQAVGMGSATWRFPERKGPKWQR